MGFGVFVGPLYDRGYLRTLVGGGNFLIVLGMMLASIADSYYPTLLAQGICVGVGMGIAYVPVLGEVSRNFSKRRPLALGVSSTGACVGGAVFPVLVRQMISRLDLAGLHGLSLSSTLVLGS